MATVIDRLLVQGGSASGSPFDRTQSIRRSDRRMGSRTIVQHNSNCDANRLLYSSTPIAKRMDFVSKMREANMGLSSMDSPNIHPGEDTAPQINFVLNGKGVNNSNRNIRQSCRAVPKLSRAGNYKTTPRDLYRVSHGICLKTGSEHSPFGHGIHAVIEHNYVDHDGQRMVKSSTSTIPRYGLNGASSTVLPPPSTAPSSTHKTSDSLRSATLTSFELTGQKYAGYPNDNFYFCDSTILDDSCFPYLRSPRKRTRLPRSAFQSDSFSDVARSQDLQDCLKIKKSFLPATHKSVSQPCPPREGDTKTIGKSGKENVNKDLRRYEFSNVNSYLSYNRSYTQFSPNLKPKMVNIPRGIVSLPAPWAESVLLKLMGDLQNPKLRLSSAKYSDIGVHEDLDEFFLIGSPTSLEKHGKVLNSQRSKSKGDPGSKSVKATEKIDEVDEDILETECVTARAPTARSDMSSVDIGDIENRKIELDARLDKTECIKDDFSKGPVSRQSSASAPGNIDEESRLDFKETFEQNEILRVVVCENNNLIQDSSAGNIED